MKIGGFVTGLVFSSGLVLGVWVGQENPRQGVTAQEQARSFAPELIEAATHDGIKRCQAFGFRGPGVGFDGVYRARGLSWSTHVCESAQPGRFRFVRPTFEGDPIEVTAPDDCPFGRVCEP